jgi:hypothetical protein
MAWEAMGEDEMEMEDEEYEDWKRASTVISQQRENA